jgi:Family of unknown function (DUF5996)
MQSDRTPKAQSGESWPKLPFEAWEDTCATLHLWTQIVGKIRLARAPMTNHWWQVPLYVTCRGLTTSPIPHESGRSFQIDFDFVDHRLLIGVSDGRVETLPLAPCSVAEFYRNVMDRLRVLGLAVRIWPVPVELSDPIPFKQDRTHTAYDPGWAHRFWQVLVEVDRVLTEFRSRCIGKVSPVHFFWGSFDMAVTRFSGRRAPSHPGAPSVADFVTSEAYSHEVSSCGFWPGNGGFGQPAFYSYAYAEPPGFPDARARPDAAFYSLELHEFILPYEAARRSATPRETVLEFFESTHAAAADLGHWDRSGLER